MSRDIISFQSELCPAIPVVKNNKEFSEYCRLLESIDFILRKGGVEFEAAATYLEHVETHVKQNLKYAARKRLAEYAMRAMRCNILRHYLDESFIGLSRRIAESPVLQRFIGVIAMDEVKVPCKSLLHKYSKFLPAEKISALVDKVVVLARGHHIRIGLEEEVSTDEIFVDACCLEANIHFPVDWLLLRDAVRTLVKSILTIRRHGLIHRIPSPGSFLTQINKCCMEMSSSRRKKDSRKERKRVLREMKKIAEAVRKHGRRYCDLLRENWESETDLDELSTQEIMGRMENVLGKLPAAVKQAHDRIIGGRKTENKDKTLSLYDDNICVVTRGKESSEVEFGNVLYLAEQADGLVVDFKLYRDAAPGDVKQLDESLDRFAVKDLDVKALAGDRGFDGPTTRNRLMKEKIYNAICPRSREELKKRQDEQKFITMQKRRAQTEGRIAIVRNGFVGNPASGKSFEQRRRDLAWAVFSHNLWVLARLPEAEEDGLLKTG
jgi:hypothetical protein